MSSPRSRRPVTCRRRWTRCCGWWAQSSGTELRVRTGSYYTPHGVVEAMVRLTEAILQRSFGIESGFASPEVVVVDPAMGTGTFLLSILRRAAATITEEEGPGALGLDCGN
ncbi:N-6 DNA methylase [Streptomyces sp. NPDC051214]|uniref:N-6 DNA methylase n=1 Tax=Streptomyces sp. NPDC051214 TaxID=3155282 RepID=UPI00341C6A8D